MTSLYSFECGPVATMSYLVCDQSLRAAYVVDTPYGCLNVLLETARREGCTITDILLTHTHWDHTANCAELKRATGGRVLVHTDDLYRLTDPMKHTIWPLPFEIEPVADAEILHGSEGVVNLSGGLASIRFIHTPGHTEGGVCFVDDSEKRVFVGDTLFNGSLGRVDLPGGDMETLVESIRTRLLSLDAAYHVYPGHGSATTIAHESATNPFVGEFLR